MTEFQAVYEQHREHYEKLDRQIKDLCAKLGKAKDHNERVELRFKIKWRKQHLKFIEDDLARIFVAGSRS